MPYVFQEYPKWVHRAGSKPALVQDADEEAAAALGRHGPDPKSERGRLPYSRSELPAPQRYKIVPNEGGPTGDVGGFDEVPTDSGDWVRWRDIARLFVEAAPASVTNLLVGDVAPAAPALPGAGITAAASNIKGKGGWPKGKPRSKASGPSVN